jgi:hypothetical protein
MSSFKYKDRKKSMKDNRVTLHAKFEEKVDYFNNNKKKLIDLKKDQKKLREKHSRFDNDNSKLTSEKLEEKLDIWDNLQRIEDEISNISNKKEDIEYLLDTGKLLHDYFDNINETAEGKKGSVNDIKNKNKDGKSVMDFFTAGSEKQNTKLKSNCLESKKKTKAEIYEDYLSKTDQNFIKNYERDIIDFCHPCGVEKILYISEGKLICPICGEESFVLMDSEKPSYKEPPREVSYFAYKRINHFNEWLAQFQAKESTDIPKDVYNLILEELKKERITNIKNLSPNKIREILKKLKKNKYYEHVPHIINRLNGIPPPIMSREIEEELRRMFKEIQVPFHKFCPANRKNFLSYSYVLHKFVQLKELDNFLPCFVLLKSREKLHQQDLIWKKICEHLKWEFIPSV